MAKSFPNTGITVGLSTDRTAITSPYHGQYFYETDTKKEFVYNGSAWVQTNSVSTTSGVTGVNNLIVPPMCQVRRTTDQTAYTSAAAISWSSTAFDTDGMWSAGSPTLITIQTAGLYLVTANMGVTANATITRALGTLYKGSTIVAYQESLGSTTAAYCSMSMLINLAAADTIKGAWELVGGSSYAVRGSTNEDYTQSRLTVAWVGRTS